MASVTKLPDGKKAVQFLDAAGARRTIRVGRMGTKGAERIGERTEYLVAAVKGRTILDGDTARWLADICDEWHAKLAGYGLCEPRQSDAAAEPPMEEPAPVTVGGVPDEYLAARAD